MKTGQFTVYIEQDEDGTFVAECPSLPGCISQGKTRVEAIKIKWAESAIGKLPRFFIWAI